MVYNTQESLGFWTSSIVRNCKYQKTQRLGNWICFSPHVREGWHMVITVIGVSSF
jgi:hypothetical protein